MNRTLKILAAATLSLALTAVGLPLGDGVATTSSIGSSGCCKQ